MEMLKSLSSIVETKNQVPNKLVCYFIICIVCFCNSKNNNFFFLLSQLEALRNKKEKKVENLQVAQVRGAVAFNVDFAQREETKSLLDKLQNDRENLRFIENQRAKAIASLPPW